MSWKHRDAKAEARDVRRFAEGTPYDQMTLLPPTEACGWAVTADLPLTPETRGGWILDHIEDWTAGYLRAKGATVKDRVTVELQGE